MLNGLDLAEERAEVAELVVAPVLQESGGLRRYLPLIRVRQVAPQIDCLAQFVDDRNSLVLLFFVRKAATFVENYFTLCGASALALPGLRYRCDELRATARFNSPLRRLAVSVENEK